MIWHVSSRNRRIARNLSLVVLLVMLEVAFLFTPTPVTQPARILSPQVNVLPNQPSSLVMGQPQLTESQTSLGSRSASETFNPLETSTIGGLSSASMVLTGAFYNDGSSIFSQGGFSLRVAVNTNGGSWGAAVNNGTHWIQPYSKGNSISYNLIWRQVNSTYYKLTLQGSANSNGQKITIQVQFENGNSQQFQIQRLQTGNVQRVGNAIYAGKLNPDNGLFQGVGFDWGDALCGIARNPNSCFDQLDTTSMLLSSQVTVRFKVASGSFTIDPSTVGTSTANLQTGVSFQQRSFFANTRYWVCFGDGTNFVYATSTDGTSWSSTTILHAGGGALGACYYDGTYLYYASTVGSSFIGATIYFRRGTPNSDGTVTWSQVEQSITKSGEYFRLPTVTVDSAGYPWIGTASCQDSACAGTNAYDFAYAYKSSTNDGTWSTAANFPKQLANNIGSPPNPYGVEIVPLTGQRMAAIWGTSGGATKLSILTYTGSSWNTALASASNIAGSSTFCGVGQGNNVHIVYQKSDNTLQYAFYTYTGNTISGDTQVQTAIGALSGVAVSIDYLNNVYAFWLNSPTSQHVYYKKYNGAVWDANPTDWFTEPSTFPQLQGISASNTGYNSAIEVVWANGASSPYNVRFATLVLQVTQPLKLTVAESGASIGTFTVSGCNVSPTTVAGDAAGHNVTADASCSLTVTVPTDGATTRFRFVAGVTTWSFSTCSNALCSTQSTVYHYQLQVTFTTSGIGGDTAASVVVVNSTSYTQAQLPIAQWWDYNSQASYAFNSPISSTSAGKQYRWSTTSGLSQSLQTNTFSVTVGGTITGSYVAQYDLKIQARDKNSMSTILSGSHAAMNMTTSGGIVTTLLADGSGYMDFGYFDSGQQVYLTAKYYGTVVNSTWHTSLYTINILAVYQWRFEYNAYVTIGAFSVPASYGTDNTPWQFTQYYITTNSSATFSSGTVNVYYQSKTYQICTQTISSTSVTCTATQSLAGPTNSLGYVNMTDGFVWVRSTTTQSYGITDVGLSDNVPSALTAGSPTLTTYGYTNTASAGSTKLAVNNTYVRISLMDPTKTVYLLNTTGPFFTSTANSFNTGIISVTIPTSYSGSYAIRVLLLQKLTNGTTVTLDKLDTAVQIIIGVGLGNQIVVNVPQDVAFEIDQSTQAQIPQVNQTQTLDLTVQVDIMNAVQNIVILKTSTNVAWVTVTDALPVTYSGTVGSFPLHLHITPGLNVEPKGWQIQIVVQGTIEGATLYQGIKYLIVVYPGTGPISIPNNTWEYQALAYGGLGVGVASSTLGLIRKIRNR